jgi:hypothetical protein
MLAAIPQHGRAFFDSRHGFPYGQGSQLAIMPSFAQPVKCSKRHQNNLG